MATITRAKIFNNGDVVTPAALHELIDSATIPPLVNSDISAAAAIADTKLATISTANKVAQSAVANLVSDLAGKASSTHTHGNITNAGAIGSTANLPVVTTASGVLSTIAAGSAGQVLTSNGGSTAPSWQTLAATSTNATNLTGGSAGTVPYQSASGTTAMLAAGSSGQVLRSNGATAPSWLTLAASATTDTTNAANITSGTLANARTTATNANTGNTIVARDASGNFFAGTITANLNGTASNVADASVTTVKLSADTQQSLVPAGAVMPFARSTKPAGWLEADGSIVPNGTGTIQGVTANFSALFSAVGTSFGSAGQLPDLRGIFVRGSGSQTISDITYSGTLGTKQGDAFQGHYHNHTSNARGPNGVADFASGGSGAWSGANITILEPKSDGTNGTPRTASETRPANISLLYCIKI